MFLHCCSVGFSRRTVKLLNGKRDTGYGLGTTSFGWNHKGLGQGIFNIVLLDIVLLEHTLPPPPLPWGALSIVPIREISALKEYLIQASGIWEGCLV